MHEWLVRVTEPAIVLIDLAALIVVLLGTAQAFYEGLRVMLASGTGHLRRDVWLRYGRWLVAALTFQLAADIIESSVTMQWEAIIRLASIAVIRTFLNYFLERDLDDLRERQQAPRDGGTAQPAPPHQERCA
jgi:uncharacterized membrane protein